MALAQGPATLKIPRPESLRELAKIAYENAGHYERVRSAKPSYRRSEWKRDRVAQEAILKRRLKDPSVLSQPSKLDSLEREPSMSERSETPRRPQRRTYRRRERPQSSQGA